MNIPPNWELIQRSKNLTDPIRATCKAPNGKVQYIYNPLWIVLAKILKFKKLLKLCNKINKFVIMPNITNPKDDMLQHMINLVLHTCVRIGNDETGTSLNEHVGLVSLTKKHVCSKNNKVSLDFIGKSGVKHSIVVNDKLCRKFIRKCYNVNDNNIYLFKYLTPKGYHRISSNDINTYIKNIWGDDFSCKDIRTYQANIQLIKSLVHSNEKNTNQNIKKSINSAANLLGHSDSICKKNYLCEHIIDLYKTDPVLFNKRKKPNTLLSTCLKDYLR